MLSCTNMYKIDKQTKLFRSGQTLFHTQDLAIIWQIENKNTLYTTIKRYLQKGVLHPITKGLYSTLPIFQIDKYALGTALAHRYCYVSCETVLANTGVINQEIIPTTFVSSFSKRIILAGHEFLFRKLKTSRLFDPTGIEKKSGFFIATKDRAISDMLYFNPFYYFDNHD